MSTHRKAVVIVGTNASGKSALGVELARHFGGEVISADSRQVYTGLDIGSGKITKKEMRGVPHHLLDVCSPKKIFTAADFKHLGEKALNDILSREKLPIIVGGTGFYIDALLARSLLANTPPDEALRAALAKHSAEELFTQLETLDPTRAEMLKVKNEHRHKRRIIRALEVARSPVSKVTPRTHSPQKPHAQEDSLDILWIGLRWSDEALRARIHERLHARMRQGLVAEVQKLHEKGLSWKRMEALGLEYRYLSRYLRGTMSKDAMLAELETKTWQYAKRQRTWFRRNPDIHWFENGNTKVAEMLVKKFLKQ